MTRFDANGIRSALSPQSASRLDRLEVFSQIDSTNTYLKEQATPRAGRFRVAIAEHQTAGRGRRENTWVSAPGESLCLSIACRFAEAPTQASALTLALGISLANALREMGVPGIQLKWPNDLLVNNAKLGGILTESFFRGGNSLAVVVGIGLNIKLGAARGDIAPSEWTESVSSLADVMAVMPSRGQLSVIVIDAAIEALRQFEEAGFAPFAADFAADDWLYGKDIVVDTEDRLIRGRGAGISDDGALLIATDAGERKIVAGSVMRADAVGSAV